ncbi:MAG TPA: malto-oligosyltrehalose trehalohydrolase [Opitutales bacterium]|nr:malto-oligosyltrehalose trehalohydrolase [Opitutales bacterium]
MKEKAEEERRRRMRRFPIGAELIDKGVHFRLWAPARSKVAVVFRSGKESDAKPEPEFELISEGNGYFSGFVEEIHAGALYQFKLDDDKTLYPDPASRFQPDGPHGPSQIVDPHRFNWTDRAWKGVSIEGQVIYEMHIGTFTKEGTWSAAARELQELSELGITVIEIMPVADFPGQFGWGYDGVNFFAPTRLYGSPDDFRSFVNDAHNTGLAVILDVVYNHAGPDGNYLGVFSADYFNCHYKNEWGEPFNFDGKNCGPVREFVITNACYWIREFHLDGFRLDATQSIHDASEDHIITALARAARKAASERAIIIVTENEPQEVKMITAIEKGGYGLDAIWNDDFHHTAMVALSGRNEAYYSDYTGSPQEFISSAKYGFLYQGQYYDWQKQPRGTPAFGFPPAVFVNFIENHDQLANSAYGHRAHQGTSPGRYRAMTALLLLLPGTPMLFQGQEFGSTKPFCYFADHKKELIEPIRRGRTGFLRQFPSLSVTEMQDRLSNPFSRETFLSSKLDFSERTKNKEFYRLHKDLLKLRRKEQVFRQQQPDGLDGAVLGPSVFLLRFFSGRGDDRLLIINLGLGSDLSPAPEPLIAPPVGTNWELLWSSESPRYGGLGTPPLTSEGKWKIPGEAAIVLYPKKISYA